MRARLQSRDATALCSRLPVDHSRADARRSQMGRDSIAKPVRSSKRRESAVHIRTTLVQDLGPLTATLGGVRPCRFTDRRENSLQNTGLYERRKQYRNRTIPI